MKNIIILLMLLTLFVPARVSADSLEIMVGTTLTVGPAFSDEGENGTNVSLHGTLALFNGAIDYYSIDDADAVRGYVGLGLGPLFAIQYGFGEGDDSIKASTTFPLDFSKGPVFPNGDMPRWDVMIKIYGDFYHDETISGINIGLLY